MSDNDEEGAKMSLSDKRRWGPRAKDITQIAPLKRRLNIAVVVADPVAASQFYTKISDFPTKVSRFPPKSAPRSSRTKSGKPCGQNSAKDSKSEVKASKKE